ncbi:MAG: phosphotransferase [Methylophilaceae bacterium]|nr:phosphotransferase [Methylophilaceae bacterium]
MNSLKRIDLLKDWLSKKLEIDFSISTASSDASFRRYFRVKTIKDSFIVMDAPPQNESIEAFLKISQILNTINVNVPEIYEESDVLGFILMQDFGSDTYLDVLSDDNQQRLYGDSIDSLIQMQKLVKKGLCHSYTQKILLNEMTLFIEWYLKRYKKIELTNKENEMLLTCFEKISKKVLNQEKFFVHRDYHCRNLMIQKSNNPGILDFQDALEGPVTYDLVSLLKDAYIEWDEEIILDHVVRYWEKAKINNLITNLEFSTFYKDFECMGIQRHLKILGIFARLSIRDKKNQYLENIPLVEKYLMDATERYRDFHQLRNFLDKLIK